jgi:hypothetical protein
MQTGSEDDLSASEDEALASDEDLYDSDDQSWVVDHEVPADMDNPSQDSADSLLTVKVVRSDGVCKFLAMSKLVSPLPCTCNCGAFGRCDMAHLKHVDAALWS